MMNATKLFLLISATLILFSACKKEEVIVEPPAKIEFSGEAEAVGAVSTPFSTTGKIKNLTIDDLELAWEVTDKSLPSTDWLVQICDPLLCYDPTITTGTFTLRAGEEAILKVQFRSSTAGTATANLSAWVEGEESTKISRVHSGTAN